MKSEAISRTGIIDGLSTGLIEAARRPWLWIVPIVVDLVLWLAPRLSIAPLAPTLVDDWQGFFQMFYAPEQMRAAAEGVDQFKTIIVETAKSVNLGSALTAGWVTPPSTLAQIQPTRYLMISDALLGPLNVRLVTRTLVASPWQTGSIEVNSWAAAIAIVAILWLTSQVLAALFFRMAAVALQDRPAAGKPGPGAAHQPKNARLAGITDGWMQLSARFAALSLFVLVGAMMLWLPLVLVAMLAAFSGSMVAGFFLVLGGGITLWLMMWFLSSLFFVGDALAFDRLPLWASLMQSLILVRGSGFRVLALATLVNLLMLGARAVWGILGGNPLGAMFAIVLNGYFVTAMTIGIFAYYQDLRRQRQAAQLGRTLSK